ncbi:MAG: type IV pilus modification protein PilV [Gammaproteobacteria bacterium]|nr:type IV pilus modification protein PilV [Gammaproteobacteria bacterium]MBU1444326.1 type IV pilus modification protein PilV [Gammaproteobacteria bacterium]
MKRPASRSSQEGMFLIEALVAIMLFVIGVLGLVGLSARALASQSDAQYRTEAANLANRIAQEAWVSVERQTGASTAARAAALADSLVTFRHNASGTDCNFSGGTSANAAVTAWATAAQAMPGATTAMQQIQVNTDAASGFNKVTVTVCWKVPTDPVPRRHVLATFVN